MAGANRGQLELFEAPRLGSATPSPECRTVAEALPAELYLGTSSWSFPGWQGIVYDRKSSPSELAHAGLAAYAQHPLLRCVGVDRSYYDALDRETYTRYAEVVPDGFRFLVKAHRDCTTQRHENASYLEPGFASDRVIAPWCEGLGGRQGPLVFQFPPQRNADAPERFADRLYAFLSGLPKGPLYAVEIRHRSWLTSRYAQALAAAGAAPCLTLHPTMPPIAAQAAELDAPGAWPALVLRWMLGGGQAYEDARGRYAPFDRLVDPDPRSRNAIASLCREAVGEGRPAYVTINNKAEGSAPLSAFALAREIAAEPEFSAR